MRVPGLARVLLLAASASLAGCAGGDGGNGNGGGGGGSSSSTSAFPFAEPGSWEDSATMPGVQIGVARHDAGRQHAADVTVRNTGATTYWYLWVPQCGLEPWAERMEGPSGEVRPREPTSHCQPCGWDDLRPGERLARTFAWDERVWDPARGEMRDAPEGRYLWTFTFTAGLGTQDSCGGRLSVEAGIEVDVER